MATVIVKRDQVPEAHQMILRAHETIDSHLSAVKGAEELVSELMNIMKGLIALGSALMSLMTFHLQKRL